MRSLFAPVLAVLAMSGPLHPAAAPTRPEPARHAGSSSSSNGATPESKSEAAAVRSRAQVVRAVLPASVRVQLLSRGEVKRVASGVVIQTTGGVDGQPGRSAVMTNAHVVDPNGLPEVTWRVLVERRGRVERTIPAQLKGLGRVPELDLAILTVEEALPDVAELAEETSVDVGDEVVVVGAPYGRALSVSGGMLSQIEAEDGEATAPVRFRAMKTDAAIGYGSSGGGVFLVPSGRLVGIVEGYRTARVSVNEKVGFDVPMPGETFIAPITKVRAFINEHLGSTATASR